MDSRTDRLKQRPGDQPLPTPGRECVQDALIAAIEERKQLGIARYNSPLMTHNGRDALQDAWEEPIDLAAYLTQMRMERADALAEATDGPAAPVPWSVWGNLWGGWFVFHAPTGRFLPVVRDMAQAVDGDDGALAGLRPVAGDRVAAERDRLRDGIDAALGYLTYTVPMDATAGINGARDVLRRAVGDD